MTLRDRQIFGNAEPGKDPEPAPPVPQGPTRIPFFSGSLFAICVGVFLAETAGLLPGPGELQLGALYGPAVAEGEWWRIGGTVVEHGSPFHLVGNMLAVFTLGIPLERSVGTGRMAAISWVGAMGAAAFALLFNFNAATVGASGMILGWVGALIPVATNEVRRRLFVSLLQVAFISVLPGVSWAGHLGGFLFGLLAGLLLRLGRNRFGLFVPVLMGASSAVALWVGRLGGLR